MAIQTYTEQEKLTAYNIYQWGVSGFTIENPNVETLQSFLDRHPQITDRTENGVRTFISNFQQEHSPNLEYYIGLPAEFKNQQTYIIEYNHKQEILGKADKGQEVENAIELNDVIKYYVTKLIMNNDFDIKSDLLEIALNNTDIAKQTKFQNDMKTRKAYIRMLNNVEEFERSIAIATNSDPSHPVSWIGENDFVNILSHIAIEDKPRYAEITKMLNVEETYQPAALVEEYKKLQQIIHSHLHPTTTVSGHTLASELPVSAGGTQTK